MKRSGTADMALFGGGIPPWLFERMKALALPMVEAIIQERGTTDFLSRMSDPFWFQSFGAVIGMDWNSSGVTTAIMRALKESINPHARDLGLYVCGGKGKESTKTPVELLRVGDRTGLDGHALAHASKLSAKVDNTAIQDGFQLYLHSFLVDSNGHWTVVQQGMEPTSGMARRYHWHSAQVQSFTTNPHTAVCGEHQGDILNLTHEAASATQAGIVELTDLHPDKLVTEVAHMKLPTYCDVQPKDVDLKRLGSVLWLAQESGTSDFEELLMLKGLGPRTLQSLTLVSEVLHGTPSRFSDPARFSFAHGSKNGRPHAVPTKIYDETIAVLRQAVDQSKLGHSDKSKAIASLHKLAQQAEEGFQPKADFDEVIKAEKANGKAYGARMVQRKPSKPKPGSEQLDLF